MKAGILDSFLDELTPRGERHAGRDFTLGAMDVDVGRFFVTWTASQLERIVLKGKEGEGAFIVYLGIADERTRCLLSLGMKGRAGYVVRFLGPGWRYYSWGVAEKIAADIGVVDPRPVFAAGSERNLKIVTFVPREDLPKVRETMFSAGGGRYGLYSKCSFSSAGRGTFYGDKGSTPARGKAGRLEEVEEERLEILVPPDRMGKAVSALRRAHPYEEPVIEAYEIEGGREFGEGRIGLAGSPLGSQEASRKLVSVLGSQPAFVSGNSECKTIMVWDGEPPRGLHEALLRDVDLYVGPDSRGLARLLAPTWRTEIVEFPGYCFVLAGAKEVVHRVREKSKRESWGLRTYLPSKVGTEGVHT